MKNAARCEGCGRLVDTRQSSGNYKKVEGWVRMRKKGANEVALRKDTGEFMHHDCMEMIRAGISPGQMSFELGEPEVPGQMSLQEN